MNIDDSVIVCQMYMSNIGEITPYIAENLNDACQNYSRDEIEHAIRQAVFANVRTWKYVEAILERKYKSQRNEDPEKYTQGKYAHLVCTSAEDLKRVMEARKRDGL